MKYHLKDALDIFKSEDVVKVRMKDLEKIVAERDQSANLASTYNERNDVLTNKVVELEQVVTVLKEELDTLTVRNSYIGSKLQELEYKLDLANALIESKNDRLREAEAKRPLHNEIPEVSLYA